MSVFRIFAFIVLISTLTADSAWSQPDPWQALAGLKADSPIVIYLKNGGRMHQRFVSHTPDRLVTDAGEVWKKDIAAVSLYRQERLWDGTLRGGAIGVGMTIPVASSSGGEGAAGVGVLAFLAGAGLGALFDAGVGKPDRPIFVDTPGKQPSLRNWTMRLSHEQLAGWLKGQRVQLMLRDGTYVRGKVMNGTETSLEMEVQESSRQNLQGNASVETAEIATVIFRQKLGGSTVAAATGGAISGFWAGALAALGATNNANDGPAIAFAAVGGALGGLSLAGAGISHMNTREITLVVE